MNIRNAYGWQECRWISHVEGYKHSQVRRSQRKQPERTDKNIVKCHHSLSVWSPRMNPGVFIQTFFLFSFFFSIWYSLAFLFPLYLSLHEREGRQNSLCSMPKLCEKSSSVIPVISRQLSWISDGLAVSPNQRGGKRYQHSSWPNIKHTDPEADTGRAS